MGFYKITRLANIFTNLFSSKKISKIILFIVLFGVIFLLFSGKVFAASYDVDLTRVTGIGYDLNSMQLVSQDNAVMRYFQSYNDRVYTITNIGESGSIRLFACDSVPSVGESIVLLATLSPGESYVFLGNSNYQLTTNSSNNFTATFEYLDGYDNTVGNLVDQLTLQNLWSQIGFAVPLIGVVVLFVIGFIIFRKLSGGSSKGKVKF